MSLRAALGRVLGRGPGAAPGIRVRVLLKGRIGSGWHDVSFQCEVDLENYAVTGFRFKIGNEISAEDAKKRGFTRFQ